MAKKNNDWPIEPPPSKAILLSNEGPQLDFTRGRAANHSSTCNYEGNTTGQKVVVHKKDGSLVKGFLDWGNHNWGVVPPIPLPDALCIRSDAPDAAFSVQLSDAKAVFLVKRHDGTPGHDEVKFFSQVEAADLWIRIRFADGEVLEGQTRNDARLLLDPGIWLRPFDSTGNNVLVYVPKSSVVEFHIMGTAVPQPQMQALLRESEAAASH